MKKRNLIFLLLIILSLQLNNSRAQTASNTASDSNSARPNLNRSDTTTWKINLLKGPASPGASLLDISPSAIQRPNDPAAFMVSVLNATDNLSAIPNSYAVDFAPAWLFGGGRITYRDFVSNAVAKNIWQTWDVSFALKNSKDSLTGLNNSKLAVGMKISVLRGFIDAKALNLVKQTGTLLSRYTALRGRYINAVVSKPGFRTMSNIEQIAALQDASQRAREDAKAEIDSIKGVAEKITFTRFGWKLDLSGGLAYSFINQQHGTLYNSGVWITGGYEDPNGFAALAIARQLYNPALNAAQSGINASREEYHCNDFGIRLLYDTRGEKFTIGTEFIYRDVLNKPAVKSSWRYAFNTDYQVGKNQIISLSIGRDFNGTVNKDANLIAALNLLLGFGTNRPVK